MSGVQQNIRKHYWLYVLKLRQGKYYVGITTKTPEIRFAEHKMGMGAAWTRKYAPLSILDQKDLGSVMQRNAERYENKVTRVYINKYGYNNVRGGDISDPRILTSAGLWYFAKDDWKIIAGLLFVMLILLYFIFEHVLILFLKYTR